MLLLRAVPGLTLSVHGGFCLGESSTMPVGLAALAAGILLFVGFLTPIASAIAGVGVLAAALSLLPACGTALFGSKEAVLFALTMLASVVVLGPGAVSVDARMFGRREIIIPPGPSLPR